MQILKKLLSKISGYVEVRIEGFFIERFINMCISKKILLWDIKKEKSTIIYAKMNLNDYKRIKNICKKTKSNIKIIKKKGIPFIVHRYRKRKIFFIFLLIILFIILFTSNYIWNIEIKVKDEISKEEIINSLEQCGLKLGARKNKIDINYIVSNLRLINKDFAWVGINIKGTNAIVEIKKTTKTPEIIDENEYCNVIATKDGIITKIEPKNGTTIVKEGDIVKKGDTLVLGSIEGKYTGTRYVHADANIKAKVWYSKKEKIFLNQQIKVPTGATEEKYSIKLNNFKINFYKPLSKFKNYDTINESKKIVLFSNFYLPIEIIKTTNLETTKKPINYTEEELTELLTRILKMKIEKKIKDKENILNIYVNNYSQKDFIEVEVIYEVLEDIGSKEKIIF